VVVPSTHVIEITGTWSPNLPMPAEMRIRLLGKNFFQRWILSGGDIAKLPERYCDDPVSPVHLCSAALVAITSFVACCALIVSGRESR